MKLSYLDLMTTDPSYNLAMEQYVFDCLPRDRMYSFTSRLNRISSGVSAAQGLPSSSQVA